MRRETFRGGKKRRRDRFYGLENKPQFGDFRDWWHRKGKPRNGNRDIGDRKEAEEFWNQWVAEGCPTVKMPDGKDGGDVSGSQRERELRAAISARDAGRVFASLDGAKPSADNGDLEKLVIDQILMTEDAGLRNALAIAIAELKSKRGAEVIRNLLREQSTRGARGTLLYALAEMDEVIDLAIFADTIVNDSFEAAEECISALEDHRVARVSPASLKSTIGALEAAIRGAGSPERRESLEDAVRLLSSIPVST